MKNLSATSFIASDRQHAIVHKIDLPVCTSGAVLFADIVGFTALLGQIEHRRGSKQSADWMTQQINQLFAALIHETHRHFGAVVAFGGDAITCWFDQDTGLRAVACGLAMQHAMSQFAGVKIAGLEPISFSLKITIATGKARRLLVGNSQIQQLDVLAGQVITRLSTLQSSARANTVLLDTETSQRFADCLVVTEWIILGVQKLAVVNDITETVATCTDDLSLAIDDEVAKEWLLSPIYERVTQGKGRFTSELRPAAILFLKFTGLNYEQDDRAPDKLDSYICTLQQILGDYGGYLLKLTIDDKGSYVLAAFGAPLSFGDDNALRVLNAALVLRQASQRFAFIKTIQIGISYGQVLAGIFGSPLRASFDLLGNEVNLANRVMMRAAPGQILVTKPIVDQTATKFLFGPAEVVPLRGSAKAVSLFELYKVQPANSLPHHHCFVGRKAEYQQLQALWQAVLQNKGQIVELEGSAGIGKSHLIAKLMEEVGQSASRVVYACCESTHQHTPYYVWQQVLQQLLSNEEGKTLTTTLANEIADMTTVYAKFEQNTTAPPETIFVGFYKLFEQLSQQAPLLLVLDDTHWIDEASLRLTLALNRQFVMLPIGLLLSHRPAESDSNLAWRELRFVSHYHALTLSEFSASEIETLLTTTLAGAVSPLLLSLVTTISQGNPFFVVEFLQTLQSQQAIDFAIEKKYWTISMELFQRLEAANCLTRNLETGEWYIAPNTPLTAVEVGLPNTIEQVILARVDHLNEATRFTLKLASVIGRTFAQPILSAAHPNALDTATLARQLQALMAEELIVGDSSSAQDTYRFRHQLTQEIAYKTLVTEDRRHLHRVVGEVLETVQPQAIETLAEHFWQSGVDEKAVLYLALAAQKAHHNAANHAALIYYNRSLTLEQRELWLRRKVEVLHALGLRTDEKELLEQLSSRTHTIDAELQQRWAEYYEAVGDYQLAQEAVAAAQTLYRQEQDRLGMIHCLVHAGIIARRKGDYRDAQLHQEEAQALLSSFDGAHEQPSATALLIKSLNELGAIYRQQGEYQKAIAVSKKALAQSQEINHHNGEVAALNTLGVVASYQRNFTLAAHFYRQALKLRRMMGDVAGEGFTLYNLGVIEHENGNFGEAEQLYNEALLLQQRTQNRWEAINLLSALGVLAYQLGDFAGGEARLRLGIEVSQQIGDQAGEAACLCNLGQIVRDQAKLGEAQTILQQALGIAKKIDDTFLIAMCQSHLAVVYLYTAQYAMAIRLARRAIALRLEIGAKELTTIDHTTLALAFGETGRRKGALLHVTKALDLLQSCNNQGPEFPERDYLICAQLLHANGKHQEADTQLQNAYQLLSERAVKIIDLQKRAAFLENVSWHRQIVQSVQTSFTAVKSL